MREFPNNLLKTSELTACLCAPGVVAEALEHLLRGDSAEPEFAASVRCDPALALRLRLLPEDFRLHHPDLLRALLLAAPVATGAAQAGYAGRWRQSIGVAHLAHTLSVRSAIADADSAWTAGLAHNLADYFETAPPGANAADWLTGLDHDGWIADAVRYHAEPLTLGRAAHPLVRIVQLAYQLVTRADAVDRVDVRAALATLQLGAGEAAQLLADSQTQARQLALRFGLVDAAAQPAGTSGFDRLARLYAGQAAQSALHRHFRHGGASARSFVLLQHSLRALFGIEHACLFAPAADGYLRLTALIPAVAGLRALAIPPDDGHSAVPRALARSAPQLFERGEAEGALVDEQIARLLGVSRLLCQPVALHDGQIGVLVVGDAAAGLGGSSLWRLTLAECSEALRPEPAVPGTPLPAEPGVAAVGSTQPTPAGPLDPIPRDRVRRAVHEVANPLTIMRNYVNLLSDRLGADSAVQRDLGIIGDEIERVARIVRGITLADEAVAPGEALELASINGIVSELVRMALGTLFAPNKVNVQIDLNPDVPPLPLQKDLLKQVLFNLAKNAVEAMDAGGHLKFTTRLIDVDGQRAVEIDVADTGPGLPDAVASQLFEPVVSEKGGDHAGLGLAISRSLVERMHGQISCTSSPQGTHFAIRLPTVQHGQAPLATTRYGSM